MLRDPVLALSRIGCSLDSPRHIIVKKILKHKYRESDFHPRDAIGVHANPTLPPQIMSDSAIKIGKSSSHVLEYYWQCLWKERSGIAKYKRRVAD
jgi:hypothetical protein